MLENDQMDINICTMSTQEILEMRIKLLYIFQREVGICIVSIKSSEVKAAESGLW